MRRLLLPRLLVLTLAFMAVQVQAAALPDFTQLAETAGKAVVNISSTRKAPNAEKLREFHRFNRPGRPGAPGAPFEEFFDQFEKFFGEQGPKRAPQKSLGSGFIISADGYVVTNNHVVEGADEIKVNLQKGTKSVDAEVVGRDSETDLALLKIKSDQPLPTLKFADSEQVKIGQWVAAIGNPFGLDHSVTAGIISAKGRVIGAGPFDNFLQTDASINPGNSGGPLLNLEGEVVGINTAIIASGQGIGFAIPASLASEVIAQLRERGKVSRGWLGVSIQDVDENTAKALGLDKPKGALVSQAMPGEPAAKAGVQAGDVIVEVNGRSVDDSAALLRRIAAAPPGETVSLTLWRKGQMEKASVPLGERDGKKAAQSGRQQAEPAESELGLTLRPLEPREAEAMGLKSAQGLLVAEVADGSPAQEAQIRAGDVILEANQRAVTSVAEFKAVLENDAKAKGVVMLLVRRQGQTMFRTIQLPQDK